MPNGPWNGTGPIDTGSARFDSMDWEDAPAFVEVDVGTTDGSRVKFSGLELAMQTSQAYRKPMLSLETLKSAVGDKVTWEGSLE